MSCVHYQFKSAMDYKTLTFEGLAISVGDLKHEIMEREKISETSFDLALTNAQTKVPYGDESELIPRNSSVVVARIPAKDQKRLPKIQDNAKLTEGVVPRSTKIHIPSVGHGSAGEQTDVTNPELTEDDRRRRIMGITQAAYDPSTYVKRNALMTGPPPPTYICHRCQKSGHWPKNCPMNNVRISTGIPSWELVDAEPNAPHAYQTKSGRWVMPRMHMEARLVGKKERPPFLGDEDAQPERPPSPPKVSVPAELRCGLCQELMSHAVLISCCGYSFCDDCIRGKLLESEKRECPQCHSVGVSPDNLVPNAQLRQAVSKFQSSASAGYSGLKISFDKGVVQLPGVLQATLSKFLPSSHPSAHLAPLPTAQPPPQAQSPPPPVQMVHAAPPPVVASMAYAHFPPPMASTPSSMFPASRPLDPPMAAIAPMQAAVSSQQPGPPGVAQTQLTTAGDSMCYSSQAPAAAYPPAAAYYAHAAGGLGPPGVDAPAVLYGAYGQPPIPGLPPPGVHPGHPPPPGFAQPPPVIPGISAPRYQQMARRRKNEYNDAWDRYLAKKDKKRRRKARSPSPSSSSSSESEDDGRRRHRRDDRRNESRRARRHASGRRSYTPSPTHGYRESRRHRRSRTPRTPSPSAVLGASHHRRASPTPNVVHSSARSQKEAAEMFIMKATHGRPPPGMSGGFPPKPASLLSSHFLPPPGVLPPPGYDVLEPELPRRARRDERRKEEPRRSRERREEHHKRPAKAESEPSEPEASEPEAEAESRHRRHRRRTTEEEPPVAAEKDGETAEPRRHAKKAKRAKHEEDKDSPSKKKHKTAKKEKAEQAEDRSIPTPTEDEPVMEVDVAAEAKSKSRSPKKEAATAESVSSSSWKSVPLRLEAEQLIDPTAPPPAPKEEVPEPRKPSGRHKKSRSSSGVKTEKVEVKPEPSSSQSLEEPLVTAESSQEEAATTEGRTDTQSGDESSGHERKKKKKSKKHKAKKSKKSKKHKREKEEAKEEPPSSAEEAEEPTSTLADRRPKEEKPAPKEPVPEPSSSRDRSRADKTDSPRKEERRDRPHRTEDRSRSKDARAEKVDKERRGERSEKAERSERSERGEKSERHRSHRSRTRSPPKHDRGRHESKTSSSDRRRPAPEEKPRISVLARIDTPKDVVVSSSDSGSRRRVSMEGEKTAVTVTVPSRDEVFVGGAAKLNAPKKSIRLNLRK